MKTIELECVKLIELFDELFDEVIIYDKYGKYKNFWKTLKFAFKLRKKKFDVAIMLHPTNRVHMMSFFAGIPIRIGYDRKMPFSLLA